MKRVRKVLKMFAIACLLLVTVAWLSAWKLMAWVMERQSAAAEIVLTLAGGNVYMVDARLRGRQIGASLAASVGPDGVLLVDTPMTAALGRKVREALDDLGAGEVELVVNTHPHPDHARGNAFLAGRPTILAHDLTRERLASRARPFWWLPAAPPLPSASLPTETFDAERSLRFNDEDVRILHLGAGHTDGDAVVYFTRSKVVHVGDLFHGLGGHTASDRRNAGGEVEGIARSLEALAALLPSDVRIVCGHGGIGQVWGRDDLVHYQEMLVDILRAMKARIAEGRSREEVLASAIPLHWRVWFEAARDDSVMHGPPDGWLVNLYRGLTAGAGGG